MKRTAKSMFINVAVAGGLLLLGESIMAQQGVPIPDPAVTPETGLTSTATFESIPPGQPKPIRADATGPQSPVVNNTVVDNTVVGNTEIPWGGPRQPDPMADDLSARFPSPAVCEICGEGEDAPPLWSVRQDVRVLSIARTRGKRLSERRGDQLTSAIWDNDVLVYRPITDSDGDPVYGFDGVISTRSLSFDVAAGYSTTVGRHLGRDAQNRDHFLEFTYWGMQKWDAFKQANATERIVDTLSAPSTFEHGNLYSSFPEEVRGFNRADQHWAVQESRLNDFELNIRLRPRSRADRMVLYPNGRWRRQCQSGAKLSYLFGMRVLTLDETFRFQSQGVLHVLDDQGVLLERRPVSGDYLIRTHNDLFGLQIGFDYVFRQCKWNWGFHGKTGPYVNFADQISRIVTDAAGDEIGTEDINMRRVADAEDASLLLELGVEGTYKIRPNVSIRASYDMMWMVGMARAAEQLDFNLNGVSRLNNDAAMFTQGVSLGIECLW